jgi:uncharacterized phage-associated protein
MAYELNTIANFFINKAHQSGCNDLTPMKLLKLVYIAHGWNLGIYNDPLFIEEVSAWKFGPVIRPLYDQVRVYRNNPITSGLPSTGESISPEDNDLLEAVWDRYGKLSGIALSQITHKPGSPWSQTWDSNSWDLIIPTDLIRDHYREMATAGARTAEDAAQH